MQAKLKGKVLQVGEVITRTSKAGNEFKSQEIVVEEIADKYPQTYAVKLVSNGIDKVKKGNQYEFSIEVKANHWKDKIYTELNCYSVKDYFTQPAKQDDDIPF